MFRKFRMWAFVGIAGMFAWSTPSFAQSDGFVELFNGKDLTGWKAVVGPGKSDDGSVFSVKEGVLHVKGKPHGYLCTERSYSNYVLQYDWKFSKDGDSGLLVHIQGTHKVWPKCVEVQGRQSKHGTIFAIGGAKGNFKTDNKAQKTAIRQMEWNTTEVICKDREITSRVNGVPISTGKGDLTEGPFGFQSEGTELQFKNIRIKELR